MSDLTMEGLAEWHEGEAHKARLGYGYHESDDFLNAAAFHQSAASLIRAHAEQWKLAGFGDDACAPAKTEGV